MNDALCRDGEVLTFECLLIVTNDNEVIWPELVAWNWFPLAVDELDRRVVTVLGEEGDGLLACLDLREQLPDVGALANIVGLSCLHGLVGAFVLLILDEAIKHGVVVTGIIILWRVFHLFHLLLELSLLLLHFHFHLLVDAFGMLSGEWRQLCGIDNARGSLALDASSANTRCAWSLHWLLVGKNREGVLCQLDIGVEVVETLVVGAVLPLGSRGSHGKDV